MPRTATAGEASGGSQSLRRGLAILGAFSAARPVIGISELADELELTRSTTHRYVSTLVALGYLRQDPGSRRYRLGPRVLDIGLAALESMELRDIAAPSLRRLADRTGYTTNLAILDGAEVVHVERVRSLRERHMDLDLHVGSRLPAYCTSLGKMLLAHLPEAELERALERTPLAVRGPNTLTDRRALLAELERIRETGVAVNNEELAPGVRSLAAPVRDRSGEVVAAINIAAHHSLAPMSELVAKLTPALLRTAAEISAAAGYRER